MNLKDKVVVITGASSGIGKELAFHMAKKQAKVVLAARNMAALGEIEDAIRKAGGTALSVPTDVSRRFQVERLINRVEADFGRLDILVNNAGISHTSAKAMDLMESDLRAPMETNFMGGVYGMWAAVPLMEKSGGGLLVYVTSIIGKRGVPKNAGYCASKFAMQGFAESVRPELASKNIRVLTICPPGVDTPFFEHNGHASRRRYKLQPVAKIARLIVRACEKETRESLLTIDAKAVYWLNVFFPRLMDWGIAKNKGV